MVCLPSMSVNLFNKYTANNREGHTTQHYARVNFGKYTGLGGQAPCARWVNCMQPAHWTLNPVAAIILMENKHKQVK